MSSPLISLQRTRLTHMRHPTTTDLIAKYAMDSCVDIDWRKDQNTTSKLYLIRSKETERLKVYSIGFKVTAPSGFT